MTNLFEDKSVLITGASSGIGRATALAFARQGARIAIADFDAAGAAETVRMVEECGARSIFIRTDITKAGDAAFMVEQTVAAFGSLNHAFNAAGILGIGSVTDCDEAQWHRVIAVNLTGVWLSMKYQVGAMLKTGGGSIVNAASAAGLIGSAGSVAYTSSKHGVVGLTRAAALDLAQSNIRVNAVCPAFVQTPMLDNANSNGRILDFGALAKMVPMGRFGTAEEIAAAVLWLSSPQSSFVTGIALPLDGGLTAS